RLLRALKFLDGVQESVGGGILIGEGVGQGSGGTLERSAGRIRGIPYVAEFRENLIVRVRRIGGESFVMPDEVGAVSPGGLEPAGESRGGRGKLGQLAIERTKSGGGNRGAQRKIDRKSRQGIRVLAGTGFYLAEVQRRQGRRLLDDETHLGGIAENDVASERIVKAGLADIHHDGVLARTGIPSGLGDGHNLIHERAIRQTDDRVWGPVYVFQRIAGIQRSSGIRDHVKIRCGIDLQMRFRKFVSNVHRLADINERNYPIDRYRLSGPKNGRARAVCDRGQLHVAAQIALCLGRDMWRKRSIEQQQTDQAEERPNRACYEVRGLTSNVPHYSSRDCIS